MFKSGVSKIIKNSFAWIIFAGKNVGFMKTDIPRFGRPIDPLVANLWYPINPGISTSFSRNVSVRIKIECDWKSWHSGSC